MKKWNKKWTIRLAWLTLAAACLCGGAALAAGDQDDPLVTLSYLTKTVTPSVLEQVEEKAVQRQTELLQKFNAAIDEYKGQLGQSGGTSGSSSATYTVVTLSSAQKLNLGVGCEVMLRVGTATVSAATSPALIDVSTGGSLNNGSALTANHLYMATIADRSVTATAGTVKLLVRGEYTIA